MAAPSSTPSLSAEQQQIASLQHQLALAQQQNALLQQRNEELQQQQQANQPDKTKSLVKVPKASSSMAISSHPVMSSAPRSLLSQAGDVLMLFDEQGVSGLSHIFRAAVKAYQSNHPSPPSAELQQQLITLAEWCEARPYSKLDDLIEKLRELAKNFPYFHEIKSGVSSAEYLHVHEWRTEAEREYENKIGKKKAAWSIEDHEGYNHFLEDE